ncbi:MAG: hypothetical protein COY81_04320 [Candidatus Pacebacteria bacterium CG_4_10_14_0_8_um_filter_43_12]|nr:MAG: hypothetical protein COU66_04035 [Candidatus Pacebacteria bacterium CG10_big_fil_rev_8_21_14_0_10_44_11]PIY79110.1 MAG: hypothetical protein COY81_04320 [Candidatus Pacebacteria bacterium CG_4_10_14_0_8_um_filter_43_12]
MSLAEPDQISKTKTLYEVGAWEIFWRNFLAGASRTIGGLVIYLAVLYVLSNIFIAYVWPVIQPVFQQMGETTDLLKQLQGMPTVR